MYLFMNILIFNKTQIYFAISFNRSYLLDISDVQNIVYILIIQKFKRKFAYDFYDVSNQND